jgi:PAS domain S-box-containing protein
MTDLTQLKEKEIALSQSNRALKMLSRCNEALIRSETENGLLADICQIAVDIGGFRLAWVGYALDDAQKTIARQSHAGIEDGYLTQARITWAENDPKGQGPASRVIRHGEPVVITDLETDESYRPWLEAARARGFKGVIALPLTDKKRTFGVMVLYLSEVRQPLPDEMHLLRELADDMAFGIVNIRARSDRQRMHMAVAQVAASVSAAAGTDFFAQLIRNMVTALGAKAGFVAKVLPGEPVTSRTIAVVVDDQVTANFDYVLQGTPCENFPTSDTCVIHEQVAQRFPLSPTLAALGAEGFVGRRLDDASGTFMGQLAVIFRKLLKDADFVVSTLQIFAARAAAELERQETDTKLREQAALLDMAQDAIVVRDLNHHVTYWNRSAELLFGWTAQEVLGRSARELLYSEPGLFDRATEQLLAQGEWTGELRHQRKDGGLLDIEGRWTLVRDAAGQPKAVLSIHTDITERKAAALAVQRSEERFRELAENIQEVFWITDPAKNQMLYISPAYEKIWGRTCASLNESPQQWLDAIHPDDRARVLEAVATKQVRGEYNEEYRIQRPDGTVRWIHDRAFPVRDENGEVLRIVGTAEDITERRQHERLAQRSQRLESIGTLAGGIAHDLNNALAPIMMSVELLRMQYPGESEVLDMIENGSKRAADMVRQLLAFAKGAAGERVSVQPGRLVKELEKLMKGSFPKNIQLVVRGDAQLPTVLGDATQLHQVLLNLCVNARDAMPHGGTLTLEAQRLDVDAAYASAVPDAQPGTYVRLRVRDTGTGIPPEILDRIFDPFFTTKGPDKGTGLGLSTVMGIIKGHGGFVQVYSQRGQGSTFAAYLPVEGAGSDPGQVTLAAVEFRGQGETILFVDDEAAVRQMARMVLQRMNFKPLTATDGADGVIQAAQHRTELRAVITDQHMPQMDGLMFVHALRQILPDIPVVVASGRMEDAVVEEFKTLGVTTRLDKPFTEAQLAAALKTALTAK